MKKVCITYNPYLVRTTITIDGQKPKQNSSLNASNTRLQDWVDKLPEILINEYCDNAYEIHFVGTQVDYEDIKTSFAPFNSRINVKFDFVKKADPADMEKTVDEIFNEIKAGPVPELKDKKIIDAFEKAKNQTFEINVVATMSSGKSTLINALLGKKLMPAANEATTATIVSIIDEPHDEFDAIAFDKDGKMIKKIKSVDRKTMYSLNKDQTVSYVELRGRIPFVKSTGMKLVLVDTPGPNNSRDENHQKLTYEMLANSDKSLVLFVLNATQLAINDEKRFLNWICYTMKEGGKQARERYIFAVNKLDDYKVADEGIDGIENALHNVKTSLEERGIMYPNIFPVSALAALEKRTEDDEPDAIDKFRKKIKKYPSFHFDSYYHYSHLPLTVHQRIDELLENVEGDDKLEIHTGIVSIEQAINQYVNKYARTTKVRDLVQSFNDKLKELAAVANLEKAIREDKSKKAELEKQIANIRKNIESAKSAQTVSKNIDKLDLKDDVEKQVISYIDDLRNQINKIIAKHGSSVEKSQALKECNMLEQQCKAIPSQAMVKIEQILQKTFKETLNRIIDEYKKYLSDLNVGIKGSDLQFDPLTLVAGNLPNLNSILEDNTETVDTSYDTYETRTRRVKKDWGTGKLWYILSLGIADNYTTETYTAKVRVQDSKDEVDMHQVASEYLQPLQQNLNKTQSGAIAYVLEQTDKLKEVLKKQFVEIDKVLDNKLKALSQTQVDTAAKTAEIAKKESNLKWLESIEKRVNDIIEF